MCHDPHDKATDGNRSGIAEYEDVEVNERFLETS
jgi:hypothetical protein